MVIPAGPSVNHHVCAHHDAFFYYFPLPGEHHCSTMKIIEPGDKGHFYVQDFIWSWLPREIYSALKHSDTNVLCDDISAFVTLEAAECKPVKESSVHSRE